MAKQRKLLSRSARFFLVLSVVLLVASIPLYYYTIESIWLEELDERNLVVADKLEQNIFRNSDSPEEVNEKIGWLHATNPDAKIEPVGKERKGNDRNFTTYLPDRIDTLELDRFRVHKRAVRFQNKHFEITVLSNIEEEGDILSGIATATIVFFGSLVAGFLLLNTFLAKKLWQPFYQTLSQVDKFNISQEPPVLPPTPVTEFSRLNSELNRLMSSASRAYNQQREFLENASHELQTPVAVMKSKLEILRQERLSNEQAETITEMERSLTRLSTLNKNLLLLAKIENDQFRRNDSVNFEEIVMQSLEVLETYISEKKLAIELNSEPISVQANETLCYTLISNLLSNACKFAPPYSAVEIEVRKDKLIFRNKGTRQLESKKIGKRFAKGPAGETGLGLAIAFQVCAFHEWELNYEFRKDQHIFSVQFFNNSEKLQNRS